VNLLQVQGNTRVLSSPRVSTLNNQKAVIKSGSDQFFVTNVTSNTVSSTAASTSNSIELTSFFSGVALDVTPQIDDDGGVILHIHPTVSAVTSQNLTVTFAGQTDTLPLALSQIRESDSVVKARSGQIIVIGGLMTAQNSNTNYQTPVLGSIPVVGNLFKSKQTSARQDGARDSVETHRRRRRWRGLDAARKIRESTTRRNSTRQSTARCRRTPR
jgi:MSHA biogenesis protein MshL